MNNQTAQSSSNPQKEAMTISTITPRLIAKTAQYVDLDLLARWEQMSALQGQKCRVGCIGLLKAGKSSLCNALTDSLDDQLFAVGLIRTTTANQERDCGDYILLDTPGLDCNENDERETTGLLESLDLIIFVHSMKIGEFDEYERDFIQRLAPGNAKSMALLDKTFWALTKLDECTENDVRQLEQKITRQITSLLGVQPRNVFTLGSTRYKKGMAENKQQMVQKSNIPAFQDALLSETRTRQESLASSRQKALQELQQQIVAQLQSQRAKLAEQLNSCAQKHNVLHEQVVASFTALHSRLQMHLNNNREVLS